MTIGLATDREVFAFNNVPVMAEPQPCMHE